MVKDLTKDCGLPLQIVETQDDRYDAFQASNAAIAASGTVALELAICHIPHLITYRVSKLTAWIASRFLKIQFVNLTNIMLGRLVVPELLQEQCTAGNISRTIQELLKKGELYEREQEGFARVKEILSNGEQTPSQNAADFILELVSRRDK